VQRLLLPRLRCRLLLFLGPSVIVILKGGNIGILPLSLAVSEVAV
jgi:hypothetical protein